MAVQGKVFIELIYSGNIGIINLLDQLHKNRKHESILRKHKGRTAYDIERKTKLNKEFKI